jgi:hypothetical protein
MHSVFTFLHLSSSSSISSVVVGAHVAIGAAVAVGTAVAVGRLVAIVIGGCGCEILGLALTYTSIVTARTVAPTTTANPTAHGGVARHSSSANAVCLASSASIGPTAGCPRNARLARHTPGRTTAGEARHKLIFRERPERVRHAGFEGFVADCSVSKHHRLDGAVVGEVQVEADGLTGPEVIRMLRRARSELPREVRILRH